MTTLQEKIDALEASQKREEAQAMEIERLRQQLDTAISERNILDIDWANAVCREAAAKARLALLRDTLQAMVDSCLCRAILNGDDCHPCADARRVLEATKCS